MLGDTPTRRTGWRRLGLIVSSVLLVLVVGLAGASTALGVETIYWTDILNDTISSAGIDGSGVTTLSLSGASQSGVDGLAIDIAAGRIYWSNYNSGVDGTISYANLNGSGGGANLPTSGVAVAGPRGLAIDPADGRIYWADQSNNTISYANLDGTGGGTVATAGAMVDDPNGVAVDSAAGRIYWSNEGNNTIGYANLSGSAAGMVSTGAAPVDSPDGIAVDPVTGKIYWANAFGGTAGSIAYANLDGSGAGSLATGSATISNPFGLAVDDAAGRLYWVNETDGISYAALDDSGQGGNVQIPSDDFNAPLYLGLVATPAGSTAPAVSGGATVPANLACSQGTWSPGQLSEFFYQTPASYSYQWSVNGNDIANATASSLLASAPGAYACRVTATNPAGSTSQTSAPYTVALPLLTVTVAGTGKGSVSGPSIQCPSVCSASYSSDAPVDLVARPTSNSEFAGWSGACTGVGSCALSMSVDRSVTARFTLIPPPNTVISSAAISSKHRAAMFKFVARGSATGFQCALVSKKKGKPVFSKCRSPKRYKHLKPGSYTFEVRAIGRGGTDRSSATKKFTIR